ncbi:MAG: VCBS repeat-containing protein [Candidatus Sumerlaeia bacterium]|nr:VCBS repeat-containing protein [Candidatus Sumerlaeia bacterium]
MRRILGVPAVLILLLATTRSATPGVSILTSYRTDELLAGLQLNPGPGFVPVQADGGFAIRRFYVLGEILSPGVSVEFEFRDTELWFLVHPQGSESPLGLASVIMSGEEAVDRTLVNPLRDLGLYGIKDLRSRLSLGEFLPGGPTGEERHVMFITSSIDETVTPVLITPEALLSSPEFMLNFSTANTFTAADYDDLDDVLLDALGARAPADFTAGIGSFVNTVPPELFSIEAPLGRFYGKFVDNAGGGGIIVDEENQPFDFGGVPGFSDLGAALYRRIRWQPDVTAVNETSLENVAPTGIVSSDGAVGIPQGVAVDVLPGIENTADDRIYYVVRSGGFRDSVYRARPTRQELGEPPPPVEQIEIPRGAELLFTNFDINPLFPQRIVDIELDSDNSMWVRMEPVRDSSGTLIYPDLFHIAEPSTSAIPTRDSRNIFLRGDASFDGRIDISDTLRVNDFERSGTIPDNPVLHFRLDVDGDQDIDLLDFAQIRTHPLTTRSNGSTDPGAVEQTPVAGVPPSLSFGGTIPGPLGQDRVFDVEIVDFNVDSFPDVTALIERGSGAAAKTYLIGVVGRGTINPFVPQPPSMSFFTSVELTMPARQMEWLDYNSDGRPDVALLSTPASGSGGMVIGFNQTPIADGTIAIAQTPIFDAGPQPSRLAVGFFDDDGFPDILVGANRATENLTIFINGGSGEIQRHVDTVADAPLGLALGRLTPDAVYDDLVIGADMDFSAIVVENGRLGVGPPLAILDTANSPRAAVIGRFASLESDAFNPSGGASNDAEDYFDFAIISAGAVGSPAIQIFRQRGAGTGRIFEPAATLSISNFTGATTAEVGDFNLDGRMDIAVVGRRPAGGGTVAIYATNPLLIPFTTAENPGPGQPLLAGRFSTPTGAISDVAVGDLDGDGDPDLVFALTGTLFGGNGLFVGENLVAPAPPAGAVPSP